MEEATEKVEEREEWEKIYSNRVGGWSRWTKVAISQCKNTVKSKSPQHSNF